MDYQRGWGPPKPPTEADDSYRLVYGGVHATPNPVRLVLPLLYRAGWRERREGGDGKHLASVRIVDGAGAPGGHWPRCGSRSPRPCLRSSSVLLRATPSGCPHAVDRLHRELRRHRPHLLAGTEIDPGVVKRNLWSERHHRAYGVLRALPWLSAAGKVRPRLALAASSNRRHRALDHVCRGRLCGNGRDRLQPHRAWQNHSGRMLYQ